MLARGCHFFSAYRAHRAGHSLGIRRSRTWRTWRAWRTCRTWRTWRACSSNNNLNFNCTTDSATCFLSNSPHRSRLASQASFTATNCWYRTLSTKRCHRQKKIFYRQQTKKTANKAQKSALYTVASRTLYGSAIPRPEFSTKADAATTQATSRAAPVKPSALLSEVEPANII